MPKEKTFYQIKVQVQRLRPSVYRTLLVDAKTTFLQLHRMIQEAFGLEDCHLWNFIKGKRPQSIEIALPDPEAATFFFYEAPQCNANETPLNKILRAEKDKVLYWYDFGDDWKMDVTLQKIIPENVLSPKIDPKNIPLVLKAKGPMLLEDTGGIWAMQDILELYELLKSKKTLTKKEQQEWEGVAAAVLGWDCLEDEDENFWGEDFIVLVDELSETNWDTFSFSKRIR